MEEELKEIKELQYSVEKELILSGNKDIPELIETIVAKFNKQLLITPV